MKKLRCNRCGYEWWPRDPTKTPAVCAKCKTPYWNKPRKYKLKRLNEGVNDKNTL
jgi:predicted Zn-ribbon and HTH transcriptional regulator